MNLESEISELRKRVEHTESVLSIQHLKSTYGDLVDRRFSLGSVVSADQLDEIVTTITDLFTDDAVWDGGPVLGVATGRAEISDRLKRSTLTFSRHLFLKPRIVVDLADATARWDLLCPCKTIDGRSWWMCGYEDDEYRFEDGSWRHSKMKLTTVFMSSAGGDFEKILV